MNEIEKNEDTMRDRQVILDFIAWFKDYSEGQAFADRRFVIIGDHPVMADKADCLSGQSESVLDGYFGINRTALEKELSESKREGFSCCPVIFFIFVSVAVAAYVCACRWLAILCGRCPAWSRISTAIGWFLICVIITSSTVSIRRSKRG